MKKHILMIVSLLLGVQLCFAAGAFAWTPLTGSVYIYHGAEIVNGTGTKFTSELNVGDMITFGSDLTRYTVSYIENDTALLCEKTADGTYYDGPTYLGPAYRIVITTLTGTIAISPGSVFAKGTNTHFLTELSTNNIITLGSDPTLYAILGVQSNTSCIFALASDNTVYSGPKWSGTAYRQDPPGTIKLTGDVSIKHGSALAYGNNTKFASELKKDDIITFGWDQTNYVVAGVNSNRSFVFVDSLNGIYQGPDYLGVTYVNEMVTTNLCADAQTRCNDGNACTNDSCDPATGNCVNTAVNCNDGNACTTDTCNPATGCVNTPITCNDGNACTTDSCNPATGCVYTPITPHGSQTLSGSSSFIVPACVKSLTVTLTGGGGGGGGGAGTWLWCNSGYVYSGGGGKGGAAGSSITQTIQVNSSQYSYSQGVPGSGGSRGTDSTDVNNCMAGTRPSAGQAGTATTFGTLSAAGGAGGAAGAGVNNGAGCTFQDPTPTGNGGQGAVSAPGNCTDKQVSTAGTLGSWGSIAVSW